MKKDKISLFIFIDALGWEVIQKNYPDFLLSECPDRKPLRTILGYSSACDPSIISGVLPAEHGLWSSYYYSPSTSPFKGLEWMRWLPAVVMNNHRTRHALSQYFAWKQGYTGYFQLYNMPFDTLPYFDYAEKQNIFAPGGLSPHKTIFDLAVERGVPYFVNALHRTDEENLHSLHEKLEQGEISFSYTTLGKLDALMHQVGSVHQEVTDLLRWYEARIQQVLQVALKSYCEASLSVFSDHGMHTIRRAVDLESVIHRLPLRYGEDYVTLYDSTMARFWFLKAGVREQIVAALKGVSEGVILSDAELRDMGVYFPSHQYGDLIFLLRGGVMIAPSFMGRKMIAGMHGYHPNEVDSNASLLSSEPIPADILQIQQIFGLMTASAGLR